MFQGVTNFGSLTSKTGRTLTFEDFDLNKDGKISEDEYNSVLNDNGIDIVQFANADKDNDKVLSDYEFLLWGQKIQMQDSVNALAGQIAQDFSGTNSKYINQVTQSLKDLIDTFSENYQDNVSIMALAFEQALPENYNQIKSSLLLNESFSIKDLDYSAIEGYNESKTYSKKGKGKDYYKDTARKLIEDNLKSQLKEKLQAEVTARGASFSDFENVFENVFTLSLEESVNACVTGRNGSLFRKSKSEFNVRTLVDNFVGTFNSKISTEIAKLNSSKTDFDLMDIDYSVVTKNEDGTENEELAKALQTGSTLTAKKKGKDYYKAQAEQMVESLRQQMFAKAQAMCEANGIELDVVKFESIFDENKESAVSTSMDGQTGVSGWNSAGTWGKALCWTAIGWGIFAFGGRSSKAVFNPQSLIEAFTTGFKTNFTNWVNEEKAKNVNKY